MNNCQETCEGCPFSGPKVGTRGPEDSPLVIVGESPGFQEVKAGEPFVGSSGTVLDNFIEPGFAYITNAMECSPPKKKSPTILDTAAHACHDRLMEQIMAYPRKVIIALGNPAVRSLAGDYSLKITQIRGHLIPTPITMSEHGILPAVHPAALMRGTGSYRQFTMDMLYGMDLATGGKPHSHTPPEWHTIESEHECKEIIQAVFSKPTELTGDLETTGLSPKYDKIITLTLQAGEGTPCYVFGREYLPWLRGLIENRKIKWCWHNGMFDVQFLREEGIQAHTDEDTLLMSYALDEQPGVHDLETVAGDVLGAPDYKHMLKPYLPNKDSSYELIPRPVLDEYSAIDVDNTTKLRSILRGRVKSDANLDKLYTQVLLPASELLSHVESTGIFVDTERLDENDEYFDDLVGEENAKIQKIAPGINPNSPQQMSNLLYNEMKLPNRSKGSTDKEALAKLPQLPIITSLLAYRKVKKAHSTYVKAMYRHIKPDGRVHATFLIHGTLTGRLASRKPNLQNIPRDPRLRGMFIAPRDRILLEVDLSQAELRSLAQLSGCPDLSAVYQEGKDLHEEVSIALYEESTGDKDLDKEHRVKSKNVNFGIVYGITKYGLQEQIGGPLNEADRMISGWYERFPRAAEYIRFCRSTPRNNQNLITCFGRKKRVGLVTKENIIALQNEAANFPHQSIASDITLVSAAKVRKELAKMDCYIVNLVHDSILIECPNDPVIINKAARLVKAALEQTPIDWGLDDVPFVADAETGDRWGSLDKYELQEAA